MSEDTKKPVSLKSLRSAGKIGSRDLYQIDVRDLVVIPGQSGRDETTERFLKSAEDLTNVQEKMAELDAKDKARAEAAAKKQAGESTGGSEDDF